MTYYVTVKQHRTPKQISWEDVLFDAVKPNQFNNDYSKSTGTITKKYDEIRSELLESVNVQEMINILNEYNQKHADLFDRDKSSMYRHFKIPKQTGGWRPIDAPCDELQNALGELANILTEKFHILYHTSAFAYIPGRSILDCLKKHQSNESEWYLKTDFSGFFPNTTMDFTMRMLSMIFPLSEVCKVQEGKEALQKALSLGFLNGGLPQGTKLSPCLTNIFMIPLDHRLFNELAKRKIVYTRYADDMHISAKECFPYKEVVALIRQVLKEFDAPYVLKDEKTHFGSNKGKNWNLGLMVNGNNDITVGYRNKKYFKCMLNNFILDTKNKKFWDPDEVMSLKGKLSFYSMVEPEYFKNLVAKMSSKYHVNLKELFKGYSI